MPVSTQPPHPPGRTGCPRSTAATLLDPGLWIEPLILKNWSSFLWNLSLTGHLWFYLQNLIFLLWYLRENGGRDICTCRRKLLCSFGGQGWRKHQNHFWRAWKNLLGAMNNVALALCLGRQSEPRKILGLPLSSFLLTVGDHIICCPNRYTSLSKKYTRTKGEN